MSELTHDDRLEKLHSSATVVLGHPYGEQLLLEIRPDDMTEALSVEPFQLLPGEPDVAHRVSVPELSEVFWGLTETGAAGVAGRMLKAVWNGAAQSLGMYITAESRQAAWANPEMVPLVRIAQETLLGLAMLEDDLANPNMEISDDNPDRRAIQAALRTADLYDDAGVRVDALWKMYQELQPGSGDSQP